MRGHMRKLALLIVFASSVLAQRSGTPVEVVPYPTISPTRFLDYDANGNNIYICFASPSGQTLDNTDNNYAYSLSVAGGTLTSIVVLTNVGTVTTVNPHGLRPGQSVVVSGSTTSALNATYIIQTVPTTSTFTITTSGVGNATYNNGPLTISGYAPLLTSPIWSIEKLVYNSSNQLTDTMWAQGSAVLFNNICANRANNLTYR